jgi:hypothetical protein
MVSLRSFLFNHFAALFRLIELKFFICRRRKAEVAMEGQFLVRQIYDDELTYNLIGAAVEVLSKLQISSIKF